MNDQSLSCATDLHLAPLRIKRSLALFEKNTAVKLWQAFLKRRGKIF